MNRPGNYFDLLNVATILTLISLLLSLLSNAMRPSVADYRTLIAHTNGMSEN